MLLVLPAVRPAAPAWSSGLGRLLDSCPCAGEAAGADSGLDDAALASSPVLSKLVTTTRPWIWVPPREQLAALLE